MSRQVLVRGKQLSWAALSVLGLLVISAATGSALTAPAHPSSVSVVPTPTLPTTTLPTTTSCSAPTGTPTLTLSDLSPTPTITVPVGSVLVVQVPSSRAPFDATDVQIADPSVLSERCSTLLADRGRVTVLRAVAQGQSRLFATVTPGSDAAMPAWLGQVIVVDNSSQ